MTGQPATTLDQLFEMRDSLLGHEVTVRGTFVFNSEGAYLTDADPDDEDLKEGNLKIPILQDDLEERCFLKVPAWGGGPYYYYDEAVIRGRLIPLKTNGFQLALTGITWLEVIRGDKRFQAFG